MHCPPPTSVLTRVVSEVRVLSLYEWTNTSMLRLNCGECDPVNPSTFVS
jgi:hypothetical protein